VLIIMEDRDVELGAEPLLNLEAARRGDVLQIDAAVDRRNRLDDLHDLVRVLSVQADRPRVDAGESFEQRRFALHHRQGGRRSNVAKAQHGRAVSDYSDGVSLDRQPTGVRRILGDRHGNSGHARCVRAGQIIAVLQRNLECHLDLAAKVQ
jgi:hypothetical protein